MRRWVLRPVCASSNLLRLIFCANFSRLSKFDRTCQATELTVLVHDEARNLKDRAREQTREERLAAHGKSTDEACPQFPVCNGLFCLFGCCAGRTDLLRALHIRGFTNPLGEAFPLLSVTFYITTGGWNHKTAPAAEATGLILREKRESGKRGKPRKSVGKPCVQEARGLRGGSGILVKLLHLNTL